MKKLVVVFLIIAVVGFGLYKLHDETSGAHAAREALEGMKKTAEEWKNTQAKTIYD